MDIRLSRRGGARLFAVLCFLMGAACQPSTAPDEHEASEVVARLRAHRLQRQEGRGEPRAVLPPAGNARVSRVEGGLTVEPEVPSSHGARVVLPDVARRPFHLRDAHSGLALDVALEGAREVKASVVDGYVVYPGAHPEGGDLVYRFTPDGTEDYLAFERAPSAPRVRYGLRLGDGVAGLRLVRDTLEVLDGSGAPRLRMAPPYLVGADGRIVRAEVSVEGCAVDRSPAAPWGRRVTRPGSRNCQVRLDWNPAEVRYPAVLDPVWSATGSLAEARGTFTTTVLPDGRVLAVGGDGGNDQLLASAELYDPATGTWAATGALSSVRGRFHTATLLGSGKVMVAGGIAEQGSHDPSTKVELYDPATGTWSLAAPMNVARREHSANLLNDGRVLVTAGAGVFGSGLTEAELYDPVTDSWTLTGSIPLPRQRHGAHVLVDGKVLVFGGGGGGTDAELYDPATGTWTPTGSMTHTRYQPASAVLADGRVLVATAGAYESELYDPATGTWSITGAVTYYRSSATASRLPDGRVLVVGSGYGSGSMSGVTEVYDPATGTWSPGLASLTPRSFHAASVLLDGRVLIAGGMGTGSSYGPLASVEVLLLDQDDVTAPTVTLTSPADGVTVEGEVLLGAEAVDDHGMSRVEFFAGDTLLGTATSAPYTLSWYTQWNASNGPHVLTARAHDTAGNVAVSAPITVNVNNDVTAPTVTLTSPVPGSTAQGTVTLTAEASDDRGVSSVEFWDGNTSLGMDTEAPYELRWDLTSVVGGPHTVTARAYDAAGNPGVSAGVTFTVLQPGTAAYDSTLRVPRCASVGTQCDSGTYLKGRGSVKAELNAPNTLQGACADGSGGSAWDPSLDRLRVYTADGSRLTTGKQAYLHATVTTAYNPTAWSLDLYYTADAGNPVWTHLATVTPTQSHAQATFVVGYTLPAGALQAVRGRFRTGGSAAPCGTGAYDDHDDVAFAVAPQTDAPPSVSFTAPTTATVSGTTTVSANASDDKGVTRVEFYVGSSLLGSDTTAPYSVAWNTTGYPNSSYTLKVVAYDTGGNTAQSTMSGVTVRNETVVLASYDGTFGAPRCAAAASTCDSGSLLTGRGPLGPEPNAPNTVDTCTDGTSGGYHADESLDRLKVSTLDGSPLAAGKAVRVEATVWRNTNDGPDFLDVYYAPDASAPVWRLLGTTQAPGSGSSALIFTTPYNLPSSGSARAVIRAVFRDGGSAGTCPGGASTDVDDLVFSAP